MERDRKDFFRKGERDISYISPGEILGGRGGRENPPKSQLRPIFIPWCGAKKLRESAHCFPPLVKKIKTSN